MKGLLPLLFIALILAACSNESTNNTTDSYTTTYQSSQQATPIQPPVNPKPQRGWAVDSITDIERRQALAEYFRKHNTTYCAVYKEIEDMEANSVRTAEKRYPDFADFEQTEKKLK